MVPGEKIVVNTLQLQICTHISYIVEAVMTVCIVHSSNMYVHTYTQYIHRSK